MCWGENKNVHPKHGTDVESVVPPNLGRLTEQTPASLAEYDHHWYIPWLYNGSNPSLLFWTMDDRPLTMEPFRVAARRAIQH